MSPIKAFSLAGFLAVSIFITGNVHAVSIAIINGSSLTTETGTTASITTNLSSLATGLGYGVTVYDAPPSLGTLSAFDQVWDISFSNTSPLSAGTQSTYLSLLQAGKGLFVMGENDSFPSRNASVIGLISLAGGGVTPFDGTSIDEDTGLISPPFDNPFAIAANMVTFAAPGGVSSAGNGSVVADNISVAGPGPYVAVSFSSGQLTNAPTGALVVVFDVNFMEPYIDNADADAFTKNLLGFLQEQVDNNTAVPEPVSAGLSLIGLSTLGLMACRRRR